MDLNNSEENFFDVEKTRSYKDLGSAYHQHARMHWGFVEDVIRNDYSFEKKIRTFLKILGFNSFVHAYEDTIKDTIKIHHAWMKDHQDSLFTYEKFRIEMKSNFSHELKKYGLEF